AQRELGGRIGAPLDAGKELIRARPDLALLDVPAAAVVGGIVLLGGRVSAGKKTEAQRRAHDDACAVLPALVHEPAVHGTLVEQVEIHLHRIERIDRQRTLAVLWSAQRDADRASLSLTADAIQDAKEWLQLFRRSTMEL